MKRRSGEKAKRMRKRRGGGRRESVGLELSAPGGPLAPHPSISLHATKTHMKEAKATKKATKRKGKQRLRKSTEPTSCVKKKTTADEESGKIPAAPYLC